MILVKLEVFFCLYKRLAMAIVSVWVSLFVVLFVYLFIQTINVTETDKQADKNEKLRIDPYNH